MTAAEKFALAMALWAARRPSADETTRAQWADCVARIARVAASGREHTTFLALCYADNGGWRHDVNPFTDSMVQA